MFGVALSRLGSGRCVPCLYSCAYVHMELKAEGVWAERR